MAGMPTSIWWTPTSSSSLAMRIFSWLEKTTPAVCSPSRSVVSSMRTAGSAGLALAMTKLERSLVIGTYLWKRGPPRAPAPGTALPWSAPAV